MVPIQFNKGCMYVLLEYNTKQLLGICTIRAGTLGFFAPEDMYYCSCTIPRGGTLVWFGKGDIAYWSCTISRAGTLVQFCEGFMNYCCCPIPRAGTLPQYGLVKGICTIVVVLYLKREFQYTQFDDGDMYNWRDAIQQGLIKGTQ